MRDLKVIKDGVSTNLQVKRAAVWHIPRFTQELKERDSSIELGKENNIESSHQRQYSTRNSYFKTGSKKVSYFHAHEPTSCLDILQSPSLFANPEGFTSRRIISLYSDAVPVHNANVFIQDIGDLPSYPHPISLPTTSYREQKFRGDSILDSDPTRPDSILINGLTKFLGRPFLKLFFPLNSL